MKKKLSLFMALMLTVSMMPFSAFAEKTDDFVEIVGGIQEFGARDENSPVSIMIDLGKEAFLNRGLVEINLKNVKTARISNPISAKFVEGTKEVGISTTVGFEDKFESTPLKGNEDRFVMRIGGEGLRYTGQENVKLMITMNLDFSNSSLGDVDVDFKDLSQTGFENKTFTIAKFTGTAQRSMFVEAKDNKTKIGKLGGSLSEFTIKRLDTLDSVKSNNEVKVTLPANIKFDAKTLVKLDGTLVTPTYQNENRQLVLKNVSRDVSVVTVNPYVQIDDEKMIYDDVNIDIELYVNNRVVDEKTLDIGVVTDSVALITVNEKGRTRIPSMTAGQTKTVEVTLDGVKGSFEKNSTIEFKVKGADVAYKNLTIVEPKAKIMPTGESAGKAEANKVNGMEVYKDRTFIFKILENDMNQIKFSMDITASSMEDGKATIAMMKNGIEQSRAELANVQSKARIETGISTVQKGTTFKARDIVIRESQSGSFEVGDALYFSLNKENMGFDITDMKISATSGVEFSEPKLTEDGGFVLKLLRKSYNAPSRIDITEIKVYSKENVVSGTAKLEIKLNKDTNSIYEGDYVNVLGAGAVKSVTVFKIGSKNYTSSGTEKQAVEAPYIKKGYTMLPVRALAEALGLSSNWDNVNKVATFSNAKKVAIVKLGESEMIVNGTPIRLAVPAEVKNGTTMIELRSLATGFNVNIEWEGTQKTATVTSN